MENNFKKNMGKRLQLLRVGKKLTQEYMSEMLNLSTSAYCKIEYGETDLTLTRINKIAEIFGIPTLELLEKIFDQPLQSKNEVQNDFSPNNRNQLKLDSIRELIISNSRLINKLEKRIETLEQLLRDNK